MSPQPIPSYHLLQCRDEYQAIIPPLCNKNKKYDEDDNVLAEGDQKDKNVLLWSPKLCPLSEEACGLNGTRDYSFLLNMVVKIVDSYITQANVRAQDMELGKQHL